jgi:hypothetical protein
MVSYDRAGQDAAQPFERCELGSRRTYNLAESSAQPVEQEHQGAGASRYEAKEQYSENGVGNKSLKGFTQGCNFSFL